MYFFFFNILPKEFFGKQNTLENYILLDGITVSSKNWNSTYPRYAGDAMVQQANHVVVKIIYVVVFIWDVPERRAR